MGLFLAEVIVGGCILVVLAWICRAVLRRYHRCTFGDSNAPHGRRTDWDMFWGRRPR